MKIGAPVKRSVYEISSGVVLSLTVISRTLVEKTRIGIGIPFCVFWIHSRVL